MSEGNSGEEESSPEAPKMPEPSQDRRTKILEALLDVLRIIAKVFDLL